MAKAKNENKTAYKYNEKFHDAWAFSLAIRGATNEDIADAFEVDRKTITRWCTKITDDGEKILTSFGEALQAGKGPADAQVVKKLFERCIGYDAVETVKTIETDVVTGKPSVKESKVTTKHIAPDVMAIMYWLNNRFRKTGEWSQRQDVNVSFDNSEDVIIYLPEKERDSQ
jgi:transposase